MQVASIRTFAGTVKLESLNPLRSNFWGPGSRNHLSDVISHAVYVKMFAKTGLKCQIKY